MKVRQTTHKEIRMNQKRQLGVTNFDVIRVVKNFPGKTISPIKVRDTISKHGRFFDVVFRDGNPDKGENPDVRIILTVIGRGWTKKGREWKKRQGYK